MHPGQGFQYPEVLNLESLMVKGFRHHLPKRFRKNRLKDLGAIGEGEDPGLTRFRHSKSKGTVHPESVEFQRSWPRWLGILMIKEFICL